MSEDLKRGLDYIGVCCVFFCHDGQGNLLLHKRSANCRDEQGCWDCGGGSMEFGETFEEAACREISEEYGTAPLEIQFVTTRNVLRENNGQPTHWMANIFVAKLDPTLVKNGEPEKIEELGWFPFDTLPEPLHSQLTRHFVAARKTVGF
ncbi:MAG: RNA pyrophosphohydrolase [Candidatus Uhrbacteria bacterium GW2011_GWE2_45_35]|uniref:RNA pyrophosphohydrolase n=2 Tax=Candidatus Uhriibacteriota TaxID=1752732 RepID=A0A0G1JIG4_9BACT|nr:MAG: RNA pyrophosphohydrolase [Candidatus Uhrbacteria bacterium GW2011_GWF2_44_350]KKU08637.1 MAG: RNA pyrophosphohydrolase [Candidatus Uhrbacteria bacterium GW2011_GWE2_45_35]HBR80286.1 RNA pyrophosphohydrolase [Candidatus Uhrbacteria bacterium]HCU31588.1 RNA pyrophosphohydrolase [Candidatus Uhrbacteria bacterium]